ncbi:MAG TPA: tetratricopeptide repeat protein, partial [Nannocystaceae bacterium]|nr:tetratricopeptide repeat protein [Nannocystaceae bacterium]
MDVAGCPDAELFVAFLGGELDEDDATALERHVDGCRACCELVAALARSPLAGRSRSGALVDVVTSPQSELDRSLCEGFVAGVGRLARGAVVGRYLVTEELGSGGMGVVYAAYDPELDRRVALKLLRARARATPGAEARLLREARAIARLSDRNVVAVYDVGVVEDDGTPVVFLAMELVEGVTLRRWIAREPRSWREIVATYLEAGRGLAAAHAAGIVHRDFKPGNVLVGDRVVVLDFGLARIVEELDRDETPAGAGRLAPGRSTITRPHAVLGTPAYMAPEQRAGDLADARSDQYAFCLALAEALLGAHPLLDRAEQPLERVIAGARVPMPLRRLLARGLAERPDDRFADMPAVLAGLERVLGRRNRRVIAAAGLVLVASVGALAWARLAPTEPVPCTGGEQRMAATWGPERGDAITSAFAAVDRPWTAHTTAAAIAGVDAWATTWITEYTEACRATRVWGEQSEQHLDRRMACLDRARGELTAVLTAFERADEAVVEHAVETVDALPDVLQCRDVERSISSIELPRDLAARELAVRAQAELAHAHVRDRLGQREAADEHVASALELARRAGHPSTLAEVLLLRGRLRSRRGELAAAETDIYDALWAAEDGRDDRASAEAWIELVWLDGYHRMAFARAEQHAAHARAAIDRRGGDPRLDALRLRNLGWTSVRKGEPAVAVQYFEDALAQLRLVDADEGRDALLLRNDLGSALAELGRWPEAMAMFEEVRLATEAWLGPEHPEVAVALNNVASAQRARGELTAALSTFSRVIEILERAHGRDDLGVGRALLNLGTVQADMGDEAVALVTFERARATIAKVGGPRHPDVARAEKGIAGVVYAQGDLA